MLSAPLPCNIFMFDCEGPILGWWFPIFPPTENTKIRTCPIAFHVWWHYPPVIKRAWEIPELNEIGKCPERHYSLMTPVANYSQDHHYSFHLLTNQLSEISGIMFEALMLSILTECPNSLRDHRVGTRRRPIHQSMTFWRLRFWQGEDEKRKTLEEALDRWPWWFLGDLMMNWIELVVLSGQVSMILDLLSRGPQDRNRYLPIDSRVMVDLPMANRSRGSVDGRTKMWMNQQKWWCNHQQNDAEHPKLGVGGLLIFLLGPKISKARCLYGIFTYIWMIFGVNVDTYSIHGAYGKDGDLTGSRFTWMGVISPKIWLIYTGFQSFTNLKCWVIWSFPEIGKRVITHGNESWNG